MLTFIILHLSEAFTNKGVRFVCFPLSTTCSLEGQLVMKDSNEKSFTLVSLHTAYPSSISWNPTLALTIKVSRSLWSESRVLAAKREFSSKQTQWKYCNVL